MTLNDLLQRLDGVKGGDGQYSARCPCHDDRHNSLSVAVAKDGAILLKCHAGCTPEAITGVLGLQMSDLFPEKQRSGHDVVATYAYKDDAGNLIAQKLRRADKSFFWRRPDGRGGWVYNRKGVPARLYMAGEWGNIVFVCEGEKDVDNLHALGFAAASGQDGAGKGKWKPEYSEQLRGKVVCIFFDNDDVGKDYGIETANALHGVAESVQLCDLAKIWPEIPEHGDVSDLIVRFGAEQAREMILNLVNDTPIWTPEQEEEKYRLAKTAAEFKDVDTKFLWYPYLPIGDYSVMMADGGTGKTILCCGICAVITTGAKFPGEIFGRNPQTVLIISAEDTGEVLRKRLKKSGASLERANIIDCMDSVGMNIAEGYDEFLATVRHYDPALVIIDPWHAFLGEKIDISRVNALRPNLQKWANIAKKCSCSMILVSHVNKRAQGENANNAATGSTDFINAARSAFRVIFDETDDNCRIMVHTKTNYAPYGPSIKYRIDDGGVVWVGFSDVTRATLEAAARKRSTPYETMVDEKKKTEINSALIGALMESANPFTAARITYDEFRKQHGDLIFGGMQPKRALDAVKKTLAEEGYFLKTGVQVYRNKRQANGFIIQQITDEDVEQIEMPT